MKKLIILAISSILLVGCQSISEEIEQSPNEVYVTNKVDTGFQEEWTNLRNEVYKIGLEITQNWEQYVEIGEHEIYNTRYNMLTIWNVDGSVGKKASEVLEKFIGKELTELVNEMKRQPKDQNTVQERIINNYGVICNNQQGKVSIRVIKIMEETTEEKGIQKSRQELLNDDFLIGNFYKGRDHQLIEAITPMLIRNNHVSYDDVRNGARCQIFKTNSGELEKIRMLIYDYGKEPIGESYDEFINKIGDTVGMDEEQQKFFVQKVHKVINHETDKEKGKVDKSSYKITRYLAREYENEDIIEVLVEFK
ncbi:hypothetical protein CS063_07545 [Sporanaerobium hydrogeniformans]|uniref:Uncharacterized protein n=1 Tax=Sporanaerobium hydrogeniformans TaxID=3072179 RepID=A0AC61DC70_9FIRM|nr:hypothetical protein [Sporanaerobium hydrogeniformans]PHV70869.1 hypothetical protein CS063_07545 [Sporanaerobium hydrogeniformans]